MKALKIQSLKEMWNEMAWMVSDRGKFQHTRR